MKLLESIVYVIFQQILFGMQGSWERRQNIAESLAKAFGKISGKLWLIARLTTIKLINRTINRN